jgi:hypothetical protein
MRANFYNKLFSPPKPQGIGNEQQVEMSFVRFDSVEKTLSIVYVADHMKIIVKPCGAKAGVKKITPIFDIPIKENDL